MKMDGVWAKIIKMQEESEKYIGDKELFRILNMKTQKWDTKIHSYQRLLLKEAYMRYGFDYFKLAHAI